MSDTAQRPTLVVVSGPPGSGKTTLAHELARAIGCPAICRDEIKEGMAHATPGYVPEASDGLAWRTYEVLFEVLEALLKAGVSVVAEAAFQDRLWRPKLEVLALLAEIRIVHAVVDAELAYARRIDRAAADPLRRIHEPPEGMPSREAGLELHRGFVRVAFDAPAMEVDTTDGYRPGLGEVVRWVKRG